MVSAGRYAARLDPEEREPVIESAFFVALVAQGFGTISGEVTLLRLHPCLFWHSFSRRVPLNISPVHSSFSTRRVSTDPFLLSTPLSSMFL